MGPDRTRPTTEQAEARLLVDIAGAKASYTPGPWVAGKEVPSDPHETENVVKAGTFYIASVHRMIGMGEHDDQTIPNARLIAAAPDLLAACKEVRDFFDGDFAPEMKGHTATLAGKMFSTLATALANAEGNPTT